MAPEGCEPRAVLSKVELRNARSQAHRRLSLLLAPPSNSIFDELTPNSRIFLTRFPRACSELLAPLRADWVANFDSQCIDLPELGP
jgi:hypothetical protein